MRRVGARQDYSTVNRAKVLRRSDRKSRKFLRDSRRSGVTRLNAKNRKEKSPKTARSAVRSLFYVPLPVFVVYVRTENSGQVKCRLNRRCPGSWNPDTAKSFNPSSRLSMHADFVSPPVFRSFKTLVQRVLL